MIAALLRPTCRRHWNAKDWAGAALVAVYRFNSWVL